MEAVVGSGRSRHWRRRAAAIALAAAATIPFWIPSTSASAYVNDTLWGCTVTDDIVWAFDDYSGWETPQKTWTRGAFNTIEAALDFDGSKLVNLTESATSGATRVSLNDNPPAGQYGQALCGAYIWINSNIYASKFFWHTARHEMMHLLQAAHGGRADSLVGGEDPTTMSTCVNATEFIPDNFLDRDAEAYLNWLHSDLSYRQINSNIGFDNNTSGWGGTNGSLTDVSSGGYSSPPYAAFSADGTSADSFVRQTIRLWVGDDIGDFEIRAVLRARAPSSTANTNVRAAVYRKNLSESGDTSCDYPRGLKNPNNLTLADMNYIVVSESGLVNVDTSWTSVISDWASIGVQRDGYQLQLRAYGNAAGSGAVRFDNVRMEER